MAQIFLYLLVFIIVMTMILGCMKPSKIKAIQGFFVAVLPKVPIEKFIKALSEGIRQIGSKVKSKQDGIL